MLYPIKAKDRKLEKEEFTNLVSRLYKVKNNDDVYSHVNFIII